MAAAPPSQSQGTPVNTAAPAGSNNNAPVATQAFPADGNYAPVPERTPTLADWARVVLAWLRGIHADPAQAKPEQLRELRRPQRGTNYRDGDPADENADTLPTQREDEPAIDTVLRRIVRFLEHGDISRACDAFEYAPRPVLDAELCSALQALYPPSYGDLDPERLTALMREHDLLATAIRRAPLPGALVLFVRGRRDREGLRGIASGTLVRVRVMISHRPVVPGVPLLRAPCTCVLASWPCCVAFHRVSL